MNRRIVLVRHGRSAHTADAGWIDAAGVHRWRDAYDAAGIEPSDAPPAALVELCTTSVCLVASDLPRAIASAERLAPQRPVRVSALLRESALEIPTWLPARWPFGVWAACIHLTWLGRILRGNHASADELQRAAAAASWLGELSHEASTIVVVTHGVFRRLLGLQLTALGWRADRRVGGYRNWSAWAFEPSASERAHAETGT